MFMEGQITNICKSAHFHLRNIGAIHNVLTGGTQMTFLGIRCNLGAWPWTWPSDLDLTVLWSQSQTEMLEQNVTPDHYQTLSYTNMPLQNLKFLHQYKCYTLKYQHAVIKSIGKAFDQKLERKRRAKNWSWRLKFSF